MEKALQMESTGSTSIFAGTGKSFSLLNKVDMDSTIDTMNYQNNFENTLQSRLLKSELLNEINQQEQITQQLQPRQSSFNTTGKVVQFGNTYIYNTQDQNSNENSSAVGSSSHNNPHVMIKPRRSLERTSSDMNQSSEVSISVHNDRNIFLESKKSSLKNVNDYDEDDFLSDSLSSSKHSSSTSNFFTNLGYKDNRPTRSPRSPRTASRSFDNTDSNEINLNEDTARESELREVENYYDDEYDYLANTNPSEVNASTSKYSEQSYNSKSFLEESSSSIQKWRKSS